jgi:hypothetical protein
MENYIEESHQHTSEAISAKQLRDSFIEYVLINGKLPASVFQFMKTLNRREAEFYDHYNSFQSLEKDVWIGIFEETLSKLKSEEVYESYSAREKLLSFYYTWIELLKNYRSYIVYTSKLSLSPDSWIKSPIKGFRESFLTYAKSLINEGIEKNEVVKRPLLSDNYDKLVWMQLMFVLKFWIEDDSRGFERTDAAIEKAVNLSFDLMGNTVLDSVMDFGKFLFQK